MKPAGLQTRIFLDSGDPNETRKALDILGFLDGQTTNPSLIAKNPETAGKKFTEKEIFDFYRKVVTEVSGLVPEGSVSIEVYADAATSADAMFAQGKEFFSWIPNAHVKFPTTTEGLAAAERAVAEGMRVNMTLCFTEEQAAAVYAATKGAKRGGVFVSPFVGRLDDRGENGMELIKNILTLYGEGDGHAEVLVASIRSLPHLLYSFSLGADIVTVPLKILSEWAAAGMPVGKNYAYDARGLAAIPYRAAGLARAWREYDISHELTEKGIERFAADWNALIR